MRKMFALILSMLLLGGCAAPTEAPPAESESVQAMPVELETPGGSTLVCEWPEYDVSVSEVTFIFTNNSDMPFSTGTYYELQEKTALGLWKTVPTVENAGWTAVEIMVASGASHAFTASFSLYDHEFHSGEYRILKDGYTAEFALVENGAISAEKPYGFGPLEEAEEADTENCLVIENGTMVQNSGLAASFLEKVELDRNCQLRRMEYSSSAASSIIDIIHEDGRFLCRSRVGGEILEGYYSYLVTDGKDLYLSNAADWAGSLSYPGNSLFLLLPEGETGKELAVAAEEMTAARLEGNITRYKLWSPDGERFAALTETPTELSIGGKGYGSTVDLQDYDSLETAIIDITWAEDSVLLTCETLEGGRSTLRATPETGPMGITIATA